MLHDFLELMMLPILILLAHCVWMALIEGFRYALPRRNYGQLTTTHSERPALKRPKQPAFRQPFAFRHLVPALYLSSPMPKRSPVLSHYEQLNVG
jgi:hypothetical protein